MSSSIPNQNYIGLLQETCTKKKLNMPKYIEESDSLLRNFKCICHLEEFTTDGIGASKKFAKQIAAQAMFEKIKDYNGKSPEDIEISSTNNSVSKILEYCSREKKESPLFSELSKENGLFVVSCSMGGFQAVGKGATKKSAKEMSADLVAKHFKIHDYIKHKKQSEKRQEVLKNSVSLLYELCQIKNLSISFKEEMNNNMFIVSCSVGDLNIESTPNISKKLAKMEVANSVLNVLNCSTPGSSPNVSSENKDTFLNTDENSSSNDEPLAKRKKVVS